MVETSIQPKERMPNARMRLLAVSVVILLILAGLCCMLIYALPLSKVRVGHLSLEVPEGYTHNRNGTDGALIISSADIYKLPIALVTAKSWDDAIDNDTLYGQMRTLAERLGSSSRPPLTATPVIVPHNMTVHGSMANDGLFELDFIGGVQFYRIVVLGSPEWHTIWSVQMFETIAGPIPDLEYNNTPLAPTFDSIVNSLGVEGLMPTVLIVASVTLFVAAGIVILLVIKTRREEGKMT
jgi:hypothetical protein